ncbi:MAG: hypothetical protein RR642_18230, partial [Solibacillus sp.]
KAVKERKNTLIQVIDSTGLFCVLVYKLEVGPFMQKDSVVVTAKIRLNHLPNPVTMLSGSCV